MYKGEERERVLINIINYQSTISYVKSNAFIIYNVIIIVL